MVWPGSPSAVSSLSNPSMGTTSFAGVGVGGEIPRGSGVSSGNRVPGASGVPFRGVVLALQIWAAGDPSDGERCPASQAKHLVQSSYVDYAPCTAVYLSGCLDPDPNLKWVLNASTVT